MNVSRASRLGDFTLHLTLVAPRLRSGVARFALAGCLVGLSMAAVPPLAAQQQPAAPINLFPPTVESPGQQPGTEAAAGESPGAAPAEAPPDGETTLGATPQYEGIQVDELQELDTESLGILEEDSGGLGLDVWAGSERGQVERLIAALPDAPSSAVLQALTTRLLLSNAQAPRHRSGATLADAVAASKGTGFLRLRAERLHAMGELAGLNRLLSIVPQRLDDPWLAQVRVDGLLLAARDQEACSLVRSAVARFPEEPYWGRALVFCQFVAEERDQAFLALDLLREQDPEGDPLFYSLTNLLIGGEVEGLDASRMTALTMAMLRVGQGKPPVDFAETAPPLLLHGVELLSKASPMEKAAARERLVEAAILPGDLLEQSYEAISFSEAELADPLAQAERLGGVRGRALLFHAASRERIGAAKAEFLVAAIAAADAGGRGFAMAQAVRSQLTAMPPGMELAWFAPTAARTLFRVGQFERAVAWSGVLKLDGVKNPESQAAYEALKPFARLAGGGTPLGAAEVEGGAAAGGEGTTKQGLLLAMILSRALGQDEPNAWPGVAEAVAAEPTQRLRLPDLLALGDAAAAGQRGETVLLAALALGGSAEPHPLALGYVVSALSTVGLGGDARALALETAIAAGL